MLQTSVTDISLPLIGQNPYFYLLKTGFNNVRTSSKTLPSRCYDIDIQGIYYAE